MIGNAVPRLALLVYLMLVGCSQTRLESAASKELIPAEWTVAEDTSAAGDVTTASLQLPAAKAIPGLVPEEETRLVLRCIDHRMQAFIDTESAETTGTDADSGASPILVPIELDSAPACD